VRINQRSFVWVILTLCVLAVPVAVLTQNTPAKDSNGKESGGLMSKFKDHIQVIRLTGMIMDKADSGLFSSQTGSATSCLKDLRKALKNKKVKAVLLRINSPGGTVPTSQEVYEAVLDLKEAGKPVVVSMGDMAASGGYYVACAADKIVANPGTMTGSIGVIMNLMCYKGLADKLGVEPETIKSGLFKDIASPSHKMTREEKEILQALVMDCYDQFTQVVAKGRNLPIEEVKRLADGRIYTGRQAQQNKLVDEIGTYTDAMALLQKICKEKYKLTEDLQVDEDKSEGFLASLLESTSLASPQANLENFVPTELSPNLTKQPLWLYR